LTASTEVTLARSGLTVDLGTAAPLRTCCGPPLRNPDAQSVHDDEFVRVGLIWKSCGHMLAINADDVSH
jgi:hypothetical protein